MTAAHPFCPHRFRMSAFLHSQHTKQAMVQAEAEREELEAKEQQIETHLRAAHSEHRETRDKLVEITGKVRQIQPGHHDHHEAVERAASVALSP